MLKIQGRQVCTGVPLSDLSTPLVRGVKFDLVETALCRRLLQPEANILDAKKLVWSQVNPKLGCTELFL
jgi:hypothetical protein